MSFGQRIRFIRGNLSRDDFGYLPGGHKNTLSVSENNEAMPQGEITIRLYELFNVTLKSSKIRILFIAWVLKSKVSSGRI